MGLKVLDLFCCGGGASKGLADAGFEVTGVDIDPQPNYPFRFVQADALTFPLEGYDFIWASPPCQAYSMATKTQPGKTYPDYIPATRARLKAQGIPWVIENVPGSPLLNPVLLCGAMFGLRTYRHRLFEASFPLFTPAHPLHRHKVTKMGRAPNPDEFINPVGHFSGVLLVRQEFGMPWATRYQLAQCVPPAYARYIAEQRIALMSRAA